MWFQSKRYWNHKQRINYMSVSEWFYLFQAKSNMMFCGMPPFPLPQRYSAVWVFSEPTIMVLFGQNKFNFLIRKTFESLFWISLSCLCAVKAPWDANKMLTAEKMLTKYTYLFKTEKDFILVKITRHPSLLFIQCRCQLTSWILLETL